jgi:hypothetical protein
MRRTLVSLPDSAWDAIDKELRPQLGNADSEVIRKYRDCLFDRKWLSS